MMPDDDDDSEFYATFIATTPGEDRQFVGIGKVMLWIVAAVLVGAAVTYIFHS